MRKVVKIAGLILVVAFIIAQFIQPDKNLQEQASEHDLVSALEVPEQVANLLKNSCYDCHSNHTRYPWYSKISPLSWYLYKHIEVGKEALNFSEFGLLEKRKMISGLSGVCELIESGSMPLVSFTLIHRDARLDEDEQRIICEWSEAEAGKLLKSGPGS